jgi:hypothetical protein
MDGARVEIVERVAAAVADPAVIHGGVFARERAHDAAETRVDAIVASDRALRADGIGVVEIPWPRAEAIRFARESANRTDLGRVAGEVGSVSAAVARGDQAFVAAILDDQGAFLRDLIVESRAAPA